MYSSNISWQRPTLIHFLYLSWPLSHFMGVKIAYIPKFNGASKYLEYIVMSLPKSFFFQQYLIHSFLFQMQYLGLHRVPGLSDLPNEL